VVVIEHNLDVDQNRRRIIDLGPEGGDGRRAHHRAGTPEDVAALDARFTGRYLRNVLEKG